jgi:hypothetical protein
MGLAAIAEFVRIAGARFAWAAKREFKPADYGAVNTCTFSPRSDYNQVCGGLAAESASNGTVELCLEGEPNKMLVPMLQTSNATYS